ncbi:MAG: S-layer homology domain-containing protein [Ruminococcaceae bacterium]|nr:S-layer homology domain-containing protein [Oscillospiraceae bacterium]
MKKIIPITGLVLSITVASVSAATSITKNDLNVSTGVLTVAGVTDSKDGMITLNIPKLGITAEQLQAMSDHEAVNKLLYCGQQMVGEDGAFEFTVTIPHNESEGLYNISIGTDSDDAAKEATFYHIDENDYSQLISSLNSAAALGQNDFDTVYDASEQRLFRYDEAVGQNNGKIKKYLYDYAKNTGLSQTDSILNTSVHKAALAAQLFDEGKVAAAESLLGSMYIADNGVVKSYNVLDDYKTYVNTEEKRTCFAEVFGDCDTIASGEKAIVEAMILTVVRYPDNVTQLKSVFEKYASYINANTSKASLKDYTAIAGIPYTTLQSCVDAFNGGIGQTQGGGGGAGGGAGGGGGGGASGGSGSGSGGGSVTDSGNNIGVAPPGGNAHVSTLNIKFEDLNSVQWAYSAISELYERKIISGKSETRFAPNDKVKREEYAKMMVDMAGIEIDGSVNAFSDVMNDAWYKGYVNTAFKNGFCNGIGNGRFGTGMEISRQDMCVMAYNVIKKLGHEIPSAELTFEDSAEFGEYAKASVAALNKAGIVSGVGGNKFNPTGSATRAEAAVIIYKLLQYLE